MPGRLRFSEALCTALVLLLLCAAPQGSLSNTATRTSQTATVSDDAPIVVVLGLANSLNDDVKRAIEVELADRNLSVIDLADQPLSSIEWPEQGTVVAAGIAGCEQAATAVVHLDVLCVLLTEESFQAIRSSVQSVASRSMSALVIDQPVARQAHVAQRVYPALSRFAVLSETLSENSVQDEHELVLNLERYRSSVPLAPQLSEALARNDALIAIPETSVFSRSTLRTVLLTAYGYGKPVIGLSRAYVKAGALITAYSTPEQIFREIAESLSTANTLLTSEVSYPRYFSIVDNANVAKSLRLSKLLRFDEYATFTDRDFES